MLKIVGNYLKKHRKNKNQQGFSLLEIMTAMVVLAIGLVALISMQTVSLESQISIRDVQIGGSLAEQFLEMLQVDALRWKNTTLVAANLRYLNPKKYAISTQTSTVWHRYTLEPVNHQMRHRSVLPANRRGEARFCIYFSYRWAGVLAGVNDYQDELIEVNTVVLVPRKPNRFSNNVPGCTNAATRFRTCSTLLMYNNRCTPASRFRIFREIRRATYVRRNSYMYGVWIEPYVPGN